MSEIVFEIVKVMVMLAALLAARHLVSWLRERLGDERLAVAEKWAMYAVLKAQQVMWAEDGAERKAYVTKFLWEILVAKDIALSDEQVDVLIEAAVKQMKIDAGY